MGASRGQVLESFEHIIDTTLLFKKQNQFPGSICFFFLEDRNVMLPGDAFPEEKELVAPYIRFLSEKLGARYVVFVTEAWISLIPEGAPSEQPDRREALIVTVDGPDLNRMVTVPILPDGSLGEKIFTQDFGGAFTNLSGNVGLN